MPKLRFGIKGWRTHSEFASRFNHFTVALSTSHVSFPALTWSANTSSWMYSDIEVPYVPASYETIAPALKGDLHEAFSIMLKNKEAVQQAEIAVERINGPILILSAKNDEQWPSTYMSEQLIERLKDLSILPAYCARGWTCRAVESFGYGPSGSAFQ